MPVFFSLLDSLTKRQMPNHNRNVMMRFPVAPPGAMMSIGFDSEEIVLETLRERVLRMTDNELIEFEKNVRKLAENPFQRQLEEARAEWKSRRNGFSSD